MAALPLSAAERGAVALLAKKLLLALLVMGAEAVTGSLIPAQDITSDPQTTLRRVLRGGSPFVEGELEPPGGTRKPP